MKRRPLRPASPPQRRTPLARLELVRSAAGSHGGSFAAASAAQRRKVAGRPCLVCGARDGVDPAHIAPRSRGGCEHPNCVVALCRFRCHRAFDDGRLDLLPYLEPRHRRELAHALQHLGLVELLERLTAERWGPVAERAA